MRCNRLCRRMLSSSSSTDTIHWLLVEPHGQGDLHTAVFDRSHKKSIYRRQMAVGIPETDLLTTIETEMEVYVGEAWDEPGENDENKIWRVLEASRFNFDKLRSAYLREMVKSAAKYSNLPPEPKILVLGLGGGALPSVLSLNFARHGVEAKIDVVELSGTAIDLARLCFGFRYVGSLGDCQKLKKEHEYFASLPFEAARMVHVFEDDAIQYLKEFSENPSYLYDLVFVDLSLPYLSSTKEPLVCPIPQVLTESFAKSLQSSLAPNGTALFNFLSTEQSNPTSVLKSTIQEFLNLFDASTKSNVVFPFARTALLTTIRNPAPIPSPNEATKAIEKFL